MSDTPLLPGAGDGDAPDMTAAELALGLLDGDEQAAALRRVLHDRAFAAEVERWRGHLAPLFDLWPEAAVSGEVFDRIERSLAPPAAAVVPRTAPAPRHVRLWQGAAGLASLAAAGLLLVLVTRPIPVPVAPASVSSAPRPASVAPAALLAAAIAPVDKGAPVAALYDPASGGLRLTAASLADATRSQELWVIAGDGVPHSLGLLHEAGATMLSITADNRARLTAGAVLAVSLEPVGGSPTGLPTGPVVAKGALTQV